MKIIKDLRKENKLTQEEFSAKLGIKRSTLAMWETEKSVPDKEMLSKIADFFEVSVDYLLGRQKKNKHYIPVLGYVRAGYPMEAVDNILDYEEISDDLAKRGEYFALSVKGDSMEAKISEGDVVVVRCQEDVNSGELAVVLINGDEATVKKMVKHENGVSLIAFNPSYSPMFFTNKEIASLPLRVLGKVVELRAKF